MSSDPEYDPAARRERYLRTRELKGRDKASKDKPGAKKTRRKLTDAERSQREAITEQNKVKAAQRKDVSSRKAQEMARLRQSLNEQRNRIVNELKEALSSLTLEAEQAEKGRIKERDAKLAKIAADREAKLASVPDIPSNAKGKDYEQHMKRRIQAIRRIKGEAAAQESIVNSEFSKAQTKANKELQTKKRFVSAVTRARQQQLQTQLTGTIDNARQRYDTLKEALKPTKQEKLSD